MTKTKKKLFCLIAVLFLIILIELTSFFVSRALNRNNFFIPESVLCKDPNAPAASLRPPWMKNNIDRFILHPYLGFVYNPADPDISSFGFLDKNPPLHKRAKDKFILGIFGGSSAEIFAQYGQDTLKERLKQDPAFKDKEITVLNLAIGGYKQPQQLIALEYLLSLGGEFDIVINLDGFNEIVLPVLRNIPHKVNPFYPRRWDLKAVDKIPSEEQIFLLADILKLKKKKQLQEYLVYCGWRRFSPTLNLIGQCVISNLNAKIAGKTARIFQLQIEQSQNTHFIGNGPQLDFPDQNRMYQELSGLWARASVLMKDTCEDNEIEYLHFLQPCQYVEGTKSMDAQELKIAYDENVPHREIVARGYPFLLEAADMLLAQGVAFYDLTKVFIDHKQPLYIDTFCHFGDKGSVIVAEKIALIIIDRLNKE